MSGNEIDEMELIQLELELENGIIMQNTAPGSQDPSSPDEAMVDFEHVEDIEYSADPWPQEPNPSFANSIMSSTNNSSESLANFPENQEIVYIDNDDDGDDDDYIQQHPPSLGPNETLDDLFAPEDDIFPAPGFDPTDPPFDPLPDPLEDPPVEFNALLASQNLVIELPPPVFGGVMVPGPGGNALALPQPNDAVGDVQQIVEGGGNMNGAPAPAPAPASNTAQNVPTINNIPDNAWFATQGWQIPTMQATPGGTTPPPPAPPANVLAQPPLQPNTFTPPEITAMNALNLPNAILVPPPNLLVGQGWQVPIVQPNFLGGPMPNSLPQFISDTINEVMMLICGMDDDALHEVEECMDIYKGDRNRRRACQVLLRVARCVATKADDAPALPITEKSSLASDADGFDFSQESSTKIVTIHMGTPPNHLSFTCLAGHLSTHAQFFAPLNTNTWQCGREGVLTLPSYSPTCFSIFLAWIYTREISPSTSPSLLKLHVFIPKQMGNSHLLKKSHKERWIQLLNCYFFADYICAPKFANAVIDQLVLAYRDWCGSSFSKVVRLPLLEMDEGIQMLVSENTVESSPLRRLIADILAPSAKLRKLLQDDGESEKPTPRTFRVRRGAVSNIAIPDIGQSQLMNPETSNSWATSPYAPHTIIPQEPAAPATAATFLSSAPTLSLQNPTANPIHPIHPPQNTHPHLENPPENLPSYQNPQNQAPPKPGALSRLMKSVKRGDHEGKKLKSEYEKTQKTKKVWDMPRCTYHMHDVGKTCMDYE